MQNEETTINLRDVLVYCFLHWRSALAIVLCGAILGGGYYVLRNRNATVTPEAEQEAAEAEDAYDASVLALEAQRTNMARAASYYKDSILMHIDPTNVGVANSVLTLGVSGSSPTNSLQALAASYKIRLLAADNLEVLAKEMGTTVPYLRELVSIYVPSDLATQEGADAAASQLDTDVEANSTDKRSLLPLYVRAYGLDEEQAIRLRDALLANVQEIHDQIAETTLYHTVSVSSEISYTGLDTGLLATQTTNANNISTAQTTITNNEKNAPAEASSSSTTTASSGISLRSLVKNSIIGAVASFLLYGFVLCLRYVLAGKPQTRGQMDGRYTLPEVGSYAYGDARFYAHGSKFDRWLRGLAGMEDAPQQDEVAGMVAANVRLYAGDADTVLVSSSVASARADELCAALEASSAALGTGCHFEVANRLVASSAARERLKGADAVIFVEEYGKSSFDQIDAELELMADANKKALGLVMA